MSEKGRTREWNPASVCRYCGLRFGDPVSDCMGPHRRESDPKPVQP